MYEDDEVKVYNNTKTVSYLPLVISAGFCLIFAFIITMYYAGNYKELEITVESYKEQIYLLEEENSELSVNYNNLKSSHDDLLDIHLETLDLVTEYENLNIYLDKQLFRIIHYLTESGISVDDIELQ